MGRPWRAPAALLGALLAVAACSDAGTSDDDPSPSTTTTSEPPTTTTEPTATTRSTTTTSTAAISTTTSTSAPCGAVPVGLTEITLTAGGADHPVRIFVPSSFAGQRLPTVLDRHGLFAETLDMALTGWVRTGSRSRC